ncbi:ABC transporter permease [Tatumella sp. OPLPL6]|uniref:ABC transporter permease n=1 Tax=Tatumella sp. OPLPL6 TaxID=1928657 RepID=UPI000C18A9BB|nr:ABC transporter permease [Tatumella sp. OPLPL6]PIJ45798.1 DNA-directed RNA polymerase subunit alpha [Tatumella sp. OPLPL6]
MNYLRTPLWFFRALTPAGRLGLILTLFWVFIALFGQTLAPYSINDIGGGPLFGGFSKDYWLGTDYLGRDMLTRIMAGSRYSIGLAFTAAILASAVGILLALLAAVAGRWIEEGLGRLNDALLVLPGKVLSLMIVAVFGSSLTMLVITAVFTYWPGAYRIAFALASQLRNQDYIRAAKLRGENRFCLAIREILPNMIHPMLTDFGLRFVYIVLLLSGLSFLGLGVQPPQADWGSLVRENLQGLFDGSPAILMPAIAIASLTIGVNLFIDSLQNMSPVSLIRREA